MRHSRCSTEWVNDLHFADWLRLSNSDYISNKKLDFRVFKARYPIPTLSFDYSIQLNEDRRGSGPKLQVLIQTQIGCSGDLGFILTPNAFLTILLGLSTSALRQCVYEVKKGVQDAEESVESCADFVIVWIAFKQV